MDKIICWNLKKVMIYGKNESSFFLEGIFLDDVLKKYKCDIPGISFNNFLKKEYKYFFN